MNCIEGFIAQHALRQPDKVAIICGNECCTYAELDARIDAQAMAQRSMVNGQRSMVNGQWSTVNGQWSTVNGQWSTVNGKRSMVNGQRSVVALRAEPTIDYFVTYFALHRCGMVAAPLERDMPERSFLEISRHLQSCCVPEGSADVLYTTGTTGLSKGVIISHRTILADAENLVGGQGFTPDLNFIISGPLNHIGSLSKIWPVMMLGGTLVIVDGLRDLNRFFDAFAVHGSRFTVHGSLEGDAAKLSAKYATFLVPASIRILIQLAAARLAALADRIDFIETGAAAISQADMQTLCRLLPQSRLYNTYASTETGIITTYNYNDGRCMAGCLGRPMPHSRVVITPEGRIACSGDTLMTGYIGEPERTATVLRDGMVYTNDHGRIDDEGMLHLMGREDDVINVGGFKVAPTEVEDVAMGDTQVADCLCIGVPHPITGLALKLLVVTADGISLDKRRLARHINEKLERYKVPQLYEQVDAIRRTYNGKPDRKFYRIDH
jgi:acyl-CoA synthetase (AMP-forming)/AMP-acid ligase II